MRGNEFLTILFSIVFLIQLNAQKNTNPSDENFTTLIFPQQKKMYFDVDGTLSWKIDASEEGEKNKNNEIKKQKKARATSASSSFVGDGLLSPAAEQLRLRPSPIFADYPITYSTDITQNKKEESTRLKGTVKDPTFRSVAIKFYTDLVSFEEKEFVIPLGQANDFNFQFQLSEPTLAKIAYGNDEAEIFLEPGDDLDVDFFGNSFRWSLRFEGKGAENNNFLRKFYVEFFRYTENQIFSEMTSRGAMDFRYFMDRIHRSKWNFYHTYSSTERQSFTPEFSKYIFGEIDYWWAYNLLRYHWEYPASKGLSYPMNITPGYYNFLGKVLVSNNVALRSKNYLNFLVLYLKLREDNPSMEILEQIDQSIFEVRSSELEVVNNTSSRIALSKIYRGERIKYLGEKSSLISSQNVDGIIKSSSWYRVRTKDGREGWVFGGGGAIIGERKASKEYKKVQVEEEVTKQIAISKVKRLRVRENPDVTNAVALLSEGEQMEYLGIKSPSKHTHTIRGNAVTDYFYNVLTSNGKIGWVFGGAVEIKKVITKQKVDKTIAIEGKKKNVDPTELYLTGRALFYTMANTLYHKIKNSEPVEVEKEIQRFIERCPYTEWDQIIRRAQSKALRESLASSSNAKPEINDTSPIKETEEPQNQNNEEEITNPTSKNKNTQADLIGEELAINEEIKQPTEDPLKAGTETSKEQKTKKNKRPKETKSKPPKEKPVVDKKKNKLPKSKAPKTKKNKKSKKEKPEEVITQNNSEEKKETPTESEYVILDGVKVLKSSLNNVSTTDGKEVVSKPKNQNNKPSDKKTKKKNRKTQGALDQDLTAELDLIALGYTPEEAQKILLERKREEELVATNTPPETHVPNVQYQTLSPAELLEQIDLEPKERISHQVKITGKIKYHKNKSAQIILYNDPISMEEVSFNLYVKPDGAFATKLKVYGPTAGKFIYGARSADIFIEPNNEIHITLQANDFENTLSFSGEGGSHNNFIQELKKKFKNEDIETKGKIYSSNASGFKKFVSQIYHRKIKYYETNQKKISYDFDQYIKGEIDYWYVYNLTNFRYENPLQYGNSKPIKIDDPNYYNYINQIGLVRESALLNPYYAYFLDLYIKDKSDEYENRGLTEIELADKYLFGKVMYYYKAKRLTVATKNGQLSEALFDMKRFIDECPYEEYKESVKTAIRETNTLLKGMVAPHFELKDDKGRTVTLSSLRGKVIYLDFWATWCNSCIRQINNSDNLRNTFKNKDVVFLYVSLDYTDTEWRNYLRRHKLPGKHVFAPGALGADIAKDYGVKKLPALFIIDKNGKIARNTEKDLNSMSVIDHINKLLLIP